MVRGCGQTNLVPFTHTQQHKFAHPHSQQHTQAPFFTVTHIRSPPFTTTQLHSHNHSQQSHSLTVLLCPTESYSHSFTFITGHPTDLHYSPAQPHSAPPTHSHSSQLTQSQSLTHSQSLSLKNTQSCTLLHRTTFILSAICTLHIHMPSHTKFQAHI